MKMKKNGFTLLEILLVIGFVGIISIVASGSFLTILQSAAKTKVLAEVKQNGGYTLGVMERMIRNARSITYDETGSDRSWVQTLNPDGESTTFRCCGTSPDLLIASESATLTCENARLTSNRVRVDDCSSVFTVVPGVAGASPDEVTINFNLSQAGTDTRIEEEATLNFQSVIALRNY